MSSLEGKKAKRRKGKKYDGKSTMATTKAGVGNMIGVKTAINVTQKYNIADNDGNSDVKNEHCEMASKVAQLADNANDPLPSVIIPQGSNPYFSGSKCLVCQKDKTSEVTTSNQDACDRLDTFPLGHFSRLPLWICAECRCSIEDDHGQKNTGYMTPPQVSNIGLQDPSLESVLSSINLGRTSPFDVAVSGASCCCKTCHEKRDTGSGQEREAFQLHQSWAELRRAIRLVYQDEGLSVTDRKEHENVPTVDNLEDVVHRLCVWDSHQLFLWLESYGRELVIEIKLNLLKYLGNGFKSSQQAKLFVAFMLEYYTKLCSACRKLRPVLKELEHGHLKKFNLNWELVNRHLFQSMVYGDHRIQNALPSLITQLRLIRSNDEHIQKQLTALLQKYIQFNEEMMIVAVIWREAEPLIQEFNLDLATLKSKQRMRRDEWDVSKKTPYKQVEADAKKADAPVHRCKCEECIKKNMYSCVFRSSAEASGALPVDLGTSDGAVNGYCVTTNFANGMPDSLDGVSYDFLPAAFSLRDSKEKCATVLENGHTDGLKSLLDDDLWMRSLPPHGRDCQPCRGLHDMVASENGAEYARDSALLARKESDGVLSVGDCSGGTAHANGVDLQPACQCHLSNLLPVAVSSANCAGNSSLPSVDLPAVDLPCECHACVQNADGATFPAIFNVLPPRPAALHLYPHIHGPNTGTVSQHTTTSSSSATAHSLKPFLHSHLNGIHLPGVTSHVKLGGGTATEGDSSAAVTTHPIVQDHAPVFHGYTDWENPYDSGKVLLSSHKYGDFFPPPILRHHHHHHHHHHANGVSPAAAAIGASGGSESTAGAHGDGAVCLANGICSSTSSLQAAAALASAAPLPSSSPNEFEKMIINAGAAASFSGLPAPPTHFNKATQVAAPSTGGGGCMQQQLLPDVTHCGHGCHHRSVKHSCAGDVVGGCVKDAGDGGGSEGDTTGCATTRTNGCSSSVGNGKATQHHSCGASNVHVSQQCCGPASKRLCDGIVEPRNNLSSAQSPQRSSSLCSSQDVDNFPCDLEESVDDSCSEQSSSTSMSNNQKDGKHCDCCYCEVFGHDAAALAPVSRNYPEMRDKLRLRLNRKKMECLNEVNAMAAKKDWPSEDRRNLDDLISFINGGGQDDADDGGGKFVCSKVVKKANKKPKKVDGKVKDDSGRKGSNNGSEFEVEGKAISEVVVRDRRGFVVTEVPKLHCSEEFIARLMDAQCKLEAEVTDAVVTSKSRGKGDGQKKPDSSSEIKCTGKGKKSKRLDSSEREDCQTPQWPPPTKGNKQQSASPSRTASKSPESSDPWEMLNGKCASLETLSRKKRKASQQSTPVSSCSGSVVSSGQSSSKESPAAQRHSRSTNRADRDLAQTTPSSPSRESFPKASATASSNGAPPPSTATAAKSVKAQAKNSPSNKAVGGVACNGTEKLHPKQSHVLSSTFKVNKEEVLSRNGIRKVTHEDLITLPSKTQQKSEKRKTDSVRPLVTTSQLSSLGHKGENGVADDRLNRKNGVRPSNEVNSLKGGAKCQRGKKQHASAPNTIDDVFVPRDIDLDNGDLDESERELEAFKRFCWNSVPVANKEKVHVNLKDIVSKKSRAAEVQLNQPKPCFRSSILVKSS